MLTPGTSKFDVIRRALRLVESRTYRRTCGVKWDDDVDEVRGRIREMDGRDERVRRSLMLAFSKIHPLATKDEFVEWFLYEFPDYAETSLMGLAYKVFDEEGLPWSIEKKCGKNRCPTTAYGITEALELFGRRGKFLQSYCKKCRAKDARERRKEKDRCARLGKQWKDSRLKENQPTEPKTVKRPLSPLEVLKAEGKKKIQQLSPVKDGPGLQNDYEPDRVKDQKKAKARKRRQLKRELEIVEAKKRRQLKGKRDDDD